MPEKEGQLPAEWRLGNRPNLNQMQAAAAAQISDDVVKARLVEEIGKAKTLTSGASALGVRVHTLPTKPKDIEDDGLFHYAVLLPERRIGLRQAQRRGQAVPGRDDRAGQASRVPQRRAAAGAVEGWSGSGPRPRARLPGVGEGHGRPDSEERGREEAEGSVDVARLQTLKINIDKAKGRMPDAIRQAYCIVVTVSDKDEVQAFKITVVG